MSAEHVCMTLIAPSSLREELFDYFSEQKDLLSGFTASEAAGHGPDVRLQTSAERVKGHADEIMVRTVLEARHAAELLERIRGTFAGSRLVYWITPVSEFGVIESSG
jgi:uncharacterized protein DUF3240